MEQDKKHSPSIMLWVKDKRGDSIAIRHGNRDYIVDSQGNVLAQRYNNMDVTPFTENMGIFTYNQTIEGLSDLKPGNTYTIAKSEFMLTKLIESNLFGYRFLVFKPDGAVTFMDMEYPEIIAHCQQHDIREIKVKFS